MPTKRNIPAEQDARTVLTSVLVDIFGDKIWDDGASETARRVLEYWKGMVSHNGDMGFKFTTFPAVANQMIVVKDIEAVSMCRHHLLPFYGTVHVAYIPNELMVGLSKIPRVVDYFARRPQTQEELTSNVATFLKHELRAHGVAVVMEARHTCLSCRGVTKYEASMITSEQRGVFLTSGEARSEFLTLIGRERL